MWHNYLQLVQLRMSPGLMPGKDGAFFTDETSKQFFFCKHCSIRATDCSIRAYQYSQ